MINLHYMTHCTNFAIQIFFMLGVVRKFGDMLQNLYAYFLIVERILKSLLN
jgi:hypothetical protein